MDVKEVQEAKEQNEKTEHEEESGVRPSETFLVSNMRNKLQRRRYLVNFLIIVIGFGACISLNGLGSELPLLVITCPEGPALPAKMAIIMVIAYVGPTLYALFSNSKSPNKVSNEFICSSIVCVLGTISMGIMAVFYDVTVTINSVEHSIVMETLVFLLALVASSRNVLLMPYLRHFEESHITSFFIGEGLSGFIPSTVALFQGVGTDPVCPSKNGTNTTESITPNVFTPPKFTITHFLLFVTSMMALSTCALWLLEYLRVPSPSEKKSVENKLRTDDISNDKDDSSNKLLAQDLKENEQKPEIIISGEQTLKESINPPKISITNGEKIYLCALMWLLCAIAHGYLNSIQVFASLPYGNSAYHLIANLSQLAATMICIPAFWLPPLGPKGITWIMGFVCIGAAYATWLAMCSPMPIWRGTTHGVVLSVILWVILLSLISYARLSITATVWQENDAAGFFQISFSNMLGTICGATFIFYVVNFTNWLVPFKPCEHSLIN